MRRIPGKVLAACALGAACMVSGGTLTLAAPELKAVASAIIWLGLAAVAIETFRWGAREGYAIQGQVMATRIEHVLRCAVMSVIMAFISVMIAAPIQQLVFELFFRK